MKAMKIMKICLKFFATFMMLVVSGFSCAGASETKQKQGISVVDPAQWELVWQDEFDSGPKPQFPDPNNWGYETGYKRNQEGQYYTKDIRNAYCRDGLLNIEAHKHPKGTWPKGKHPGQDGSISSASLTTRGKVEKKYGLLVMRAKIETRPGTWGAWWTLGAKGRWPDCGECDIYEFYKGKLLFNVAWWKEGDRKYKPRWDNARKPIAQFGDGWAENFHVWQMLWDEKQVKLFLDGVLYNTWDTSKDDGDDTIKGFKQPHYMIINQAIGGNSGGDASKLKYPTSYTVDYVRWYQKREKKR